jgi:hypothetical protein
MSVKPAHPLKPNVFFVRKIALMGVLLAASCFITPLQFAAWSLNVSPNTGYDELAINYFIRISA